MDEDEDAARAPTQCQCVGRCVGFECLKQRCTALVSLGRAPDARALLAAALAAPEHAAMPPDLRTILRVTVAGPRRARDPSPPRDPDDRAARPRPSPAKRRRVDDPGVEAALGDCFDCIICSKLLYEPVTTPCGHTFCRNCLSRAIDFADTCPMCRTVLHLEDPSALPVTNVLRDAIQLSFGEEYDNRRKEVEGDAPSPESAMNRLPLFPLNAVVFPMQRFPMHIFEARYRLMLRRIMQGSRKFGLIALKRTREGGSELCDVGCVLEVTKADRFPDGRSLIETVARERFKVHGRTEVDGYLVGRTEIYEDTEDTDTDEVHEVETRVRGIVNKLMERGSRLPTMQHALQRAGDVPTESQGPGALGMWLAGMLVSDDNERQHMLEMRNSATRLREMVAILERFRDSMAATANANGENGRECCVQ